MKKRIISALLAVCLLVSLGTVGVFADGGVNPCEEDPCAHEAAFGDTHYATLANAVAAANASENGGTITLLKDVSVTLPTSSSQGAYVITQENVKINGAGMKVTGTGTGDNCGHVFIVRADNVTIQNLTIEGSNVARSGIQAYGNVKNLKVTGVTSNNNFGYGLLVNNGATVTASDFNSSGNGWGSVNVDGQSAGATVSLTGGTLQGDLVLESKAGGTNTVTLNSVDVSVVKTNETNNVGNNKIDINGGNIGTVTLNGQSKDTVEISNAEVDEIKSTNSNADTPNISLSNSKIGTVPESGVDMVIGSGVTIDGEPVDTKAEAEINGQPYATLAEALAKAQNGQTVKLLKDVDLTAELSITKNITINGNGKKLTLTAAGDSQGLSIGKNGTASIVTLDDVKLTITGTQNTSADGIDVWGTLNLKNSTVSISDLRSAFVMQGGASAKLNISNSNVIVEDITGNGSNGGYVVIDDSNVTFDNVGSHGLSVEEITVTDSSLSFTDVAYCALYGQEIVLGSGADVEIEDCGTGLPRDGWGNVKYQAPVQVKVVAGDTDNGITVKSGASLTVTGTNDAIYIPKGTGFVSNGYVSADIDLGDDDMNVVTFVKNSIRQIELVKDGTEIKLPDPGKYLGREFVGWECSLDDHVYPEGYEYKVTRDVTFTAVWEAAAYDIVIDDDILHGDIWTSPKSEAEAGDTVYIYVDPDTGYVLDDIDVYYGYNYRNSVKVSYVRNNTYRFEMPNADVYITATFKANGMPFVDVHRTQWFYDSIYYVWSNDMMEGDSATTFNPDGTMTRAMFWAVLGRMDGQTITGTNWVEQARNWAMREGVSDGTNPNDYVTREQMVTMLWRYAGEKNGSANLNRYTDSGSVSGYAVEAMRWAIGNGVIQGVTSTTLAPKANATRAECATIFMRFDKM